jgi:hypothetical protein
MRLSAIKLSNGVGASNYHVCPYVVLCSNTLLVNGLEPTLQRQCSMQKLVFTLLLQLYQQEQLARQAAEASEAKALAAASEHAQLFEALLAETQRSSHTNQRRAQLASVASACSPQRTAAAHSAGSSSNSKATAEQLGTAGGLQNSPKRCLSASSEHGAAAAAACVVTGGDVVQQRARCHKRLQQGLAAERKALAEVAAAQRRAAAAAQLEESRRVSVLVCRPVCCTRGGVPPYCLAYACLCATILQSVLHGEHQVLLTLHMRVVGAAGAAAPCSSP